MLFIASDEQYFLSKRVVASYNSEGNITLLQNNLGATHRCVLLSRSFKQDLVTFMLWQQPLPPWSGWGLWLWWAVSPAIRWPHLAKQGVLSGVTRAPNRWMEVTLKRDFPGWARCNQVKTFTRGARLFLKIAGLKAAQTLCCWPWRSLHEFYSHEEMILAYAQKLEHRWFPSRDSTW